MSLHPFACGKSISWCVFRAVSIFFFCGFCLIGFPRQASAICIQNGNSVLCTGIDLDGFLTTQNNLSLDIEAGALVRNINTVERRGNCPLSFPAISAGDNSTVSNEGDILTFGVCGTGIQTGDDSRIINSGKIDTIDALAFGIDSGVNSTVINDGSIATREFVSYGVFANDGTMVTNTENGSIETNGLVSSGINGRHNVTVDNAGIIRTTGQGSHGIDLLGNGTVSNTGRIEVEGFQSVGIRLRAGPGTVTNSGVIFGTYTGATDSANPEDGIQIDGAGTTVVNDGTISMSAPGSAGIRVLVNSAGDASISNAGSIAAPAGGVVISVPQGRFALINSGVISATDFASPAIKIMSGPESLSFVTNTGVIAVEEGSISIRGGDGREEIINRGIIAGRIALAGGNDLLTLQSGSVLDSAVNGGSIDGGSGTDDLVLTGSGALESEVIGFEELTKFGSGLWLLQQDAAFTSRVRVIEGELDVESGVTLSSADISIFPEGTLNLAGTAVGPVINMGSLTVSAGARIDGTLTQSVDGTLTVLVSDNDFQGTPALTVLDSVVINGTLRVDVSNGPLITDGTILLVLTASAVSGSIAAVDVGISDFLSGMAIVGSNSVQVVFDRLPYETAARTANSRALAGALDTGLVSASNEAEPFFKTLDAMSLVQAGDALDNLTTSLPLALTALDLLAMRETITALTPQSANKHGVWGTAGRSYGAFDSAGDGHLNRRATRLTAGGDFRIGETQSVGFSVSKLDYRARSLSSRSQVEGSAYVFGAIYSATWNAWTGTARFMAGDLKGASQRLSGLTGTSPVKTDGDGNAWAFSGCLHRSVNLSNWIFETEYGLTGVTVSRGAVSEIGAADAALVFHRIREDSLRANIAIATNFSIGSITPRLRMGLSQELNDSEHTVNATLALLPDAPFSLGLKAEEKTWVETEVTIPFSLHPGVEMALTAGGVLNDKTGGTTIELRMRFDW